MWMCVQTLGVCRHGEGHLTLVWTVLNIGLRRSNIVKDFPEEANIVLRYHPCPVSLPLPLILPKLQTLTFLSAWDL